MGTFQKATPMAVWFRDTQGREVVLPISRIQSVVSVKHIRDSAIREQFHRSHGSNYVLFESDGYHPLTANEYLRIKSALVRPKCSMVTYDAGHPTGSRSVVTWQFSDGLEHMESQE